MQVLKNGWLVFLQIKKIFLPKEAAHGSALKGQQKFWRDTENFSRFTGKICKVAHFSRELARKIGTLQQVSGKDVRIFGDPAHFSRAGATKTFLRATISRTFKRKTFRVAHFSRRLARKMRCLRKKTRDVAQPSRE
jgi:hypothetical protein